MSYELRLMVRREEGVLIGVLGLVCRRGFEAVRVEARLVPGQGAIRIGMTVESDRRIEPLIHQLRRLHEVEQADLASA